MAPKGGYVLGILVDGNPPTAAATRKELDGWIASARAPNSWTLDSVPPQPPFEVAFDVPREHYFLIDLRTMKIVEILAGDALAARDALRARLAM